MTKRGFTLIELLVALVIMSTVIGLAVTAFRLTVFQGQESTDLEKLQTKELIQFHKISQSIRSAQTFYMRNFRNESELVGWGDDRVFRFVTVKPFLVDSTMAMASVTAKIDLATRQQYLEYCEVHLIDVNDIYQDECDSGSRLRYLEGIRDIKMEYFGWKDRLAQTASTSQWMVPLRSRPLWKNSFDASKDGIMPFYFRIELVKNSEPSIPQNLYFKFMEENPRVISAFYGAIDG